MSDDQLPCVSGVGVVAEAMGSRLVWAESSRVQIQVSVARLPPQAEDLQQRRTVVDQ